MRRNIFTYLAFIILSMLVNAQNSNLRFEKNKGQWNDSVFYKAEFTQGKVFLLQNKINIIVFDSNNRYFHPHGDKENTNLKEKYSIFSIQPYKAECKEIVSETKLNGYTNYFLGNDKQKWQSNVPSYQTVIYKNVYPNVDWEISSENKSLKHSYIIHPNGQSEIITTLYKGIKNLHASKAKLTIETFNGNIEENELFIYQKDGSKIIKIDGEYSIERNEEGFLVSYIINDYDKSKDLIIDPSLVFCTYSGAHSDNWGMTSCYDKKGFMISGGIVYGGDYPFTEGAYDSTYSNNWDCVITKYDSLGQNLIFSTFLGGEYCEMPHSMVVNNNDEIVIFGTTGSGDFPTTYNAFQSEFKGGNTINYEGSLLFASGIDIFVSTLNANGTQLLASTFVGGTNNDGFNFKGYYGNDTKTLYDGNDSLYANFGDCARGEVITDNDNNVLIASCTFSYNFPTTENAYKKNISGGQDAVVFKLDKSLSQLIYSTYLGGLSDDAAYSIDIDNNGRAYVCGGTTSDDFPTTPNAYNTNYNGGSADAFISALSPDGSSLDYSTLFGSNQYDQAFFIRLDKESNPYIFGQTKAPGSTLIHNAIYAIPNSGQLVAKFSTQLDSLCFSTVFGSGDGMINISPSGFAVDVCNRIYCAGWGRIFKYFKSTLGYTSLGTENLETTSDAYMDITDGTDFYIISLTMDASQLDYATFFGEYSESSSYGNDHVDGGTSRFDRYGNFYLTICASCSGSQGMPTTDNAYSSSNNASNCNIASVKFAIHNDFAVADFSSNSVDCKNNSIQFKNHSRGTSFKWDFGDSSPISTEKEPTHSYSKAGVYTVTLIAFLSDGCRVSDTLTKKILILDNSSHYLDTISVCGGKPINIGIENLYLNSDEEVTFQWTPASGLSAPYTINPYATIYTPTLFRLIVKVNGCMDTLYRFVTIDKMESEIPDTLEYCDIPYIYNIENTLKRTLSCSWNRDFSQPIEMINNESAVVIKDFGGKYLYIRYSLDGCSDIDSIYLKFTGVKFKVNVTDAGCENDATGKAELLFENSLEDITIVWSYNDNGSESIDNIPAGNYSVKVTNNVSGCSSEIEFTVLAITNLNMDAEIQNADCNNLCNGKITVNVSGGESPYTYLWDNGVTKNYLTNICSGEYTLTVTDKTGCAGKKTFKVENSYNLQIKLTATQNNCANGCSAVINSEVEGGKEPYKYLWNTAQTVKNLSDVCCGYYFLTVEDAAGCKDTSEVTVTYIDKLFDFEASADKRKVYDGAKIHLTSTYIEDMNYYWTPSSYLATPDNYETYGTIYETTIYNVSVTDQKGCNKMDTVLIEVEVVNCDKPNIFIPNAFSPNNDGKNDILYVSGDYIESMDWIIYDRWGEKVFHSTDITQGWDGKYKNNDCQAGVYYYKLEIKCEGGKTFLTGGDVTLIR
ncbi:MAG: gliding motility-associated C-terminal domain-containing protein [Bacteroidales bacterium]|nr:gliding motility-associated C-terminal domain-containing protein [Bacteroidales bacterium]